VVLFHTTVPCNLALCLICIHTAALLYFAHFLLSSFLKTDGGQGGGILEVSNDEDDEILAAFKALSPTVDQALKELKDV
jgi:hypothetical protein